MRPQNAIGLGLAFVGLVAICLALFIVATKPLIAGDPNGTLTKAVLCAIGGFFGITIGYYMVSVKSKKDGSKSKDEPEDDYWL